MFQNLSERFSQLVNRMRGQARLTDNNIQDALNDVRNALIEADVFLMVIDSFLEQVKQKALGQTVINSIHPGEAFIKIVHDELAHIMGDNASEINLATTPPAIILFAGLQGSGKTTSVAKLALWLKQQQNKKVLVVSTDIYRPAAISQLETLANQLELIFFPSATHQQPIDIARAAIDAAKKQFVDVVIIDTAGRLHINEEMMAEIKALHKAVNPIETFFVIDSMTGQDAANTAKAFDEALPLTGVILTKTDGDARGGAALSVRQVTGKPIKFIGVGEKPADFELFHPDRIASRILDMGDIVSLVEQTQRHADKEQAEKLTKKILKGKTFDFNDLLLQFEQMEKMGGLSGLIAKLPGINSAPQSMRDKLGDKSIIHNKALILSMTKKERRFPALINGSRKKRIAAGAGLEVRHVNLLLRQFEQMQKMMKKMSKPGAMKKLMQQIPGGFNPADFM